MLSYNVWKSQKKEISVPKIFLFSLISLEGNEVVFVLVGGGRQGGRVQPESATGLCDFEQFTSL